MPPALAAIAEPRREQILRLVWDAERSAGDIASHLPVTFGAVSQHLAVLLEAGLVTVRKDGRHRYYTANRVALGPFAAALEQTWSSRLGELKRLAEAEQRKLDAEHAATHARKRRKHKPATPSPHTRGKTR